jgi:YggT family protein
VFTRIPKGWEPVSCTADSGRLRFSLARRGPVEAETKEASMRAVLDIIFLALDLYKYVIIASAIMSWLIAFNVVNIRHEFVRSIWNTLVALTEPLLAPIRRFLPNTGGIDLSPVVLFLLILLIERIIALYIYPYVF